MEDPNAGRSSRAQFARDEEEKGNIRFEVVWNDGEPQRLIYLVQLKSLFSKQLPNMPKHYIIRIVMDRNHRSLCLLKDNHVIAGICFRPFHSQKFCELVFVAVSAVQQVKGFGTRIMNTLKEHAKTEHFEYFLT
jgi:histone acetyltransferase